MLDIRKTCIDEETGEIDLDEVSNFQNEVLDEFADSPEGQIVIGKYGDVQWAGFMMDYAMDHYGVTLQNLSLAVFKEVVFQLFPKKVSVEASKAGEIITELRAFWQYLDRAYQLANATSILKELDPGAADRLQRELANPANFGMPSPFSPLVRNSASI